LRWITFNSYKKNRQLQKIGSIQVLRGLAAIGVVFFHILAIEKKYSANDLVLPFIFRTGQAGVDLFFVISGFIMVYITSNTQKKTPSAARFLLHRFIRIYPYYWIYFFIVMAVSTISPALVNASLGHRLAFTESFFLLPNAYPVILVAWSLSFEVYFYLVFAVLLRMQRAWMIAALSVWVLLLVTINLYITVKAVSFQGLLASPYTIEFIFGAFSAMPVMSGNLKKVPVFLFVVAIAAVCIFFPFLFFRYYSKDNLIRLMHPLVFGLLFSVLLISFVCVEIRTRIKLPRFLIALGDMSYSIYLSHLLILGFFGRIWAAFFLRPSSAIDNILMFLFISSAVIFFSWLAYRFIERPLYRQLLKWSDQLKSPFPEMRHKIADK
jgi:exopolysaccharide production protein ExoZ